MKFITDIEGDLINVEYITAIFIRKSAVDLKWEASANIVNLMGRCVLARGESYAEVASEVSKLVNN